MLAPLSFLKEYIALKAPAEKIAEKLLLSGTKVETIKEIGKEIVFELEITPNRPDTLSMIGLARELAALFNLELNLPDTELFLTSGKATDSVPFEIRNKKLIPAYSLVKLTDVKVEPSAKWLAEFLELSGIRPINNIVDITNFVMLETGQPMHAFDASKIKGKLVVRGAKKGERIKTLDSIERVLPEGAIIIEDSEKLVDLAGLMGGENSQIDKSTTEIVLLVPIYDPTTIRKTSLATNLRTEASGRFEKKLDLNNHLFALNRAVKLLSENCGARASSKVQTTPKVDERTITVDLEKIESLIGIKLEKSEIFDLLSSVGFKIRSSSYQDQLIEIQIPSFRNDIGIEEDIIEEISRLYGYNKLPKTLPQGQLLDKDNPPSAAEIVRELLLRNGFNELTGFTLVSKDVLETFGFNPDETLKVLNPASSDFEYLRPSLLINLVNAISVNKNRTKQAFFETAKVYSKELDPATKLPKQNLQVAFVSNQELSVVKGVLEEIFKKAGQQITESTAKAETEFAAAIEFSSKRIPLGSFGKIRSEILKKFEIETDIFAGKLFIENFEEISASVYEAAAKYPSVFEDFSFYLDKKYQIGDLVKNVKDIDKLISGLELKDIYQDLSGRSITLGLEFNDPQKTLSSVEIADVRKKVIQALKSEFKVDMKG